MKTISTTAIIMAAVYLLTSIPVQAQLKDQVGVGRAAFKGSAFNKKKPSRREAPQVEKQAVMNAKLDALRAHVASSDYTDSDREDYSKIQTTVESNLDLYLPNYAIIDRRIDPDTRTYEITIKARIDERRIQQERSKVAPLSNIPVAQKSPVGMLFVARKAVEVEISDPSKTKATREILAEDSTEEETVSGNSVSFSGQVTKDKITKTANKTTIKSDKVTYSAVPSGGFENKILNVFKTSKMRVVPGALLKAKTGGLIDPVKLMKDFGRGDDLSAETLIDIEEGSRKLKLAYFGVGTMTVGRKSVNPVNGLTQVTVTVSGQIYGFADPLLPELAAVVGPVPVQGFGKNETDAQTNGLVIAGERAAKEVVAQLRNLGFR